MAVSFAYFSQSLATLKSSVALAIPLHSWMLRRLLQSSHLTGVVGGAPGQSGAVRTRGESGVGPAFPKPVLCGRARPKRASTRLRLRENTFETYRQVNILNLNYMLLVVTFKHLIIRRSVIVNL